MSVRDLLAHVLLGLVLLGGFFLVAQILTPLMGITGYVVTMVIFLVIGYFLNDMVGRRLSRTARASSSVPVAPAYYPPQQRTYSSPSQQMQVPVSSQVTSQAKRYTPEQVRLMLQTVEERYNMNEIDRTRYEQLLTELVFSDAYGLWWTIDARTGKWVQNRDGAWVEAEPPPWLTK
jgi:hypothetical protein